MYFHQSPSFILTCVQVQFWPKIDNILFTRLIIVVTWATGTENNNFGNRLHGQCVCRCFGLVHARDSSTDLLVRAVMFLPVCQWQQHPKQSCLLMVLVWFFHSDSVSVSSVLLYLIGRTPLVIVSLFLYFDLLFTVSHGWNWIFVVPPLSEICRCWSQ